MPPVTKKAAPAPAGGSVNFGDPGFYASAGGFDLPPGRYALEFHTQMYTPTKADGTPTGRPAYLAVMLTAHPLNGGDPIEKPLGMGAKTSLSFTPSVDGKGLDPIAGAPAQTASDQSNWSIFKKSMEDTGLPEGVFTGSLTAIDGIWVATALIDEPADRKNMKSRTGEAAEEPRKPGKVPVVVEILEDGKPWEGTGGFDFAQAAAPAKAASKVVAAAPKAAVAKKPVVVAALVEEEATESTDEDVQAAALAGCADVLEKSPAGCTRVAMRVGVFNAVKKAYGDDMAQLVQNTYMGSDEALNSILGSIGYVSAGAKIVVAE